MASSGDTILIAAGTYNETSWSTWAADPAGAGRGDDSRTFASDNAANPAFIDAAGDVSQFLTKATAYSGAAGAGVTVAANGVTLTNLDIDGFLHGVGFQSDVSGTTLTDVDVMHSVIGIEKGSTANLDGLTINGGSITDGYIGIDFAKSVVAGAEGRADGLAENVTIDGMSFSDLTAKGIYAEALSHALITGIAMNEVGFYGIGPAFGGGAFGNPNRPSGLGIELNLKNGDYEDVTITDFSLTNTGTSDLDNAAAIAVKTRDTGSPYGAVPAEWVDADPVVISNGTITGDDGDPRRREQPDGRRPAGEHQQRTSTARCTTRRTATSEPIARI